MCGMSSRRVQRGNAIRGGRNKGCSVMRVSGNDRGMSVRCSSRNVRVSKDAGATWANRNNRESWLVKINGGDSGRVRSQSGNEGLHQMGGLLVSIWLSSD